MQKLYWISTLGHIQTASVGILILTISLFVIFVIWYIVGYDSTYNSKENAQVKQAKKFLVSSFIVGVITVIPIIFIPSSQELYVIYGLGGTIDWINEHPDAQQLPEKTVQVLNKMADDYINKEEK